jgi:hypothetical protein
MLERIQKTLNENWKLLLVLFGGIAFGALFFGRFINGISFVGNSGEIGIFINRNQLPNSVDVTGEWMYEAVTNDNDIVFPEDGCRKRFGTVNIIQNADSYAVRLTRERKIKEECGKTHGKDSKKNVIPWNSENAVVLVNEKKLFLWFVTQDASPRYGYISVTIIKSPNDVKPSKLQGTMYYLENSKNTWFKARIYFYKPDSSDGEKIKSKWLNNS